MMMLTIPYGPGARWDTQTGMIADAKLKDLTPQMPVIFIKVGDLLFSRSLSEAAYSRLLIKKSSLRIQ